MSKSIHSVDVGLPTKKPVALRELFLDWGATFLKIKKRLKRFQGQDHDFEQINYELLLKLSNNLFTFTNLLTIPIARSRPNASG